MAGRIGALLQLGAGFHPDLTGRENVWMNASLLGLTRRRTRELFDGIWIFPASPISSRSRSGRTRAA